MNCSGLPGVALLAGALLVACTVTRENLFVPVDPEEPGDSEVPVILAAGDIGACDSASGTEGTARILDRTSGIVLALGDIAYPGGEPGAYRECYHPWWGRHRNRTRPVPGNHDYEFAGGAEYFAYFGPAAGRPGAGYYSFQIGDWLILALNSQIDLGAGSPQARWLEQTLAASPSLCSLAYLHHPRFSSGKHGALSWLQPAWEILDAAGVDVVLSGHDHHYERFAPMDAFGRPDPDGVRQFVVGTGGAYVLPLGDPAGGSEVRNGETFGVLRLELEPDRYAWEFVPVEGGTFTDDGSASCR